MHLEEDQGGQEGLRAPRGYKMKTGQGQCAAFSLLQKAHLRFLLSASSCVLCMFLLSSLLGMSRCLLTRYLSKPLVRSFLMLPPSLPLLPSCSFSLSSFPLFLSCLLLFETEFHTVAHPGLELMIIILSQTPVCWDYGCESPLLMFSWLPCAGYCSFLCVLPSTFYVSCNLDIAPEFMAAPLLHCCLDML